MLRRRVSALIFALALVALAQPPQTCAAGASLPSEVESGVTAQLKKSLGKKGVAGCVVSDLDTGDTLLTFNADTPLAPASNMKLITTTTALAKLGADFKYVTRILARGAIDAGTLNGDLCIVGCGDPNISGRFHNGEPLALFRAWAEALKSRGIKGISGDLQYDDSLYSGPATCSTWPDDDQYTKWYCAEVSALAFNDNCVGIKVTPGKAGEAAKIETIPPTAYVKVVNQTTTATGRKGAEIGITRPRNENTITVKGKVYAQSTWGYTIDVTVHDPACFAATVFKETLQAAGITVGGAVKSVTLTKADADAANTLVEHHATLTETLNPINTNSQNLHAEMLLRRLGVQAAGKGTFDGGCAAVRDYLKAEGLLGEGMVFHDGSGLAAEDRVSARLLAAVLYKAARGAGFETFRDSLAEGGEGTLERRLNDPALKGKLFAKTGYINGVRALSGYLLGTRRLAFSILMTDCVSSRECQDEIVKLLAKA